MVKSMDTLASLINYYNENARNLLSDVIILYFYTIFCRCEVRRSTFFHMNQWSKIEILAPLLNDILSMPSHKSWPLLPMHLHRLLCIDVVDADATVPTRSREKANVFFCARVATIHLYGRQNYK